MPLLPPNVSYRPDNTPLFAPAAVGGSVITAAAFTATGEGQPNADGRFVAQGDAAAGAPALPFQMRTSGVSALQQWNLGMTDAPAGGNSGNNFALIAYDDASLPLSTPLAINRASGAIEMGNSVTVGDGTAVGGALLQVDGDVGLGYVYDAVYNRPVAGAEVVLSTFNNVGAAIALVPYTPTNSGLFTLTMEVRTDTTGYNWTNGTDIISGYLANVAPPFALLSDSFTTCDSLANPGGFFYPSGYPAGVYVKDIVAVINLNAGVAYQPTISIGGAFNLGATGGVRFFIQPMLA